MKGCKDWLNEKYPIQILGKGGVVTETLVNCKRLVKKYLYLCRKEYGKRGGKCCKSCKQQGNISINYQLCERVYAAFLPAVNTTSQPVNWSRTVSQVVYTTRELGASRDFPNFDLHL